MARLAAHRKMKDATQAEAEPPIAAPAAAREVAEAPVRDTVAARPTADVQVARQAHRRRMQVDRAAASAPAP